MHYVTKWTGLSVLGLSLYLP
ncbi:protein of unknown function [Streptomyces sp. KY75]|nr:protein of unknown function [Streptomyces sp. KY75]CAD5981654.1 protein of unknown function [Streptomyces sp. KY70]